MGHKRADITGQRFGRWVVQHYSHSIGYTHYWLCRCDCGTERAIARPNIGRGSKSCGCIRDECLALINKRLAPERRTGMCGAGNINAKLCEDDVRDIRHLLDAGEKQRLIAEQYGVCPSVVSHINNGVSWRHVS